MLEAPEIIDRGSGRETKARVFSWYLIQRLFAGKWRKFLLERLTEPLHLNVCSLFVALFGSFRAKVAFDLIIRPQYAFSILHAADWARANGHKKVTMIEFGVGDGSGLLNICRISSSVMKSTGIGIEVVGFDTGRGMPPPVDYRDHPEVFTTGDFSMHDPAALKRALPSYARLIIGDISDTVGSFLDSLSDDAPIGFVSIDVDYYSSAKKALSLFSGPWHKYMPMVALYLDDVDLEPYNPWCGEQLAVREFNDENRMRKIAPFTMLRTHRIFKNAQWIDQIFTVHILDHPRRNGKILS